MKKIIAIVLIFCIVASTSSICLAVGQWQDLGGGYKFRVDGPHTGTDTGKYHVHVNKGNNEIGSEGVDGSKSHGDNMNNVPNSVKKKIKEHPEYKRAQKKQEELEKAKKEIKEKNLKIDWWHIGDVILAIAIVVAATATFFFPGDDVGAWINLLRAIGAGWKTT